MLQVRSAINDRTDLLHVGPIRFSVAICDSNDRPLGSEIHRHSIVGDGLLEASGGIRVGNLAYTMVASRKPKAGSGPPATSRIDVSLGIKINSAQLPTADATARFKKAITDGTLSVILEQAFTAVLRNVSTVSVGRLVQSETSPM